ncbi:hypothetical protein KY347_03290, partial [Candidatus Woesearchaeota archaeon]|nr:hypothetical protein [Candidatus Woesearchaeota archaeon]
MLLLSLTGIVLVLRAPDGISPYEKPPFKVDQLLLKVLIKSNESFRIPVNIMDISDGKIDVAIEPRYLSNIVSLSESSFTLEPGETKTVYVDFSSTIEEENIVYSPGAYAGSLLVNSGRFTEHIPMVVEIETQDVLFDTNLEISAKTKDIPLGGNAVIQVNLFNLKKMGLANVKMDYFVKDIMGNIIMTEQETVVVETRATFTKTISIPGNLNPGDYIFIARAGYGHSVGTSTLLFKVPPPEEEEPLVAGLNLYCTSYSCWAGFAVLAVSLLTLLVYLYFGIGSFLYDKIKGRASPAEEKTAVKEAKETEEKVLPIPPEKKFPEKGITKLFRDWSNRRKRAKEKVLKKKIEAERQKIELKEKEEKLKIRLKKRELLLREEKIKIRRKKAFEFFHGLGLVKTEKEKKEYEEQREKEAEKEAQKPRKSQISGFFRAWRSKRKRAKGLELRNKLELEKQKLEFEEKKEKLKIKLRKEEERQREKRIGERKEELEIKKRIEEERERELRKSSAGKCKRLIDKGYRALDKSNLKKSERIYAKLMEVYINLPSERKAEIFKDINSFYKSLLLKKNQLRQKKEDEKIKELEKKKYEESKDRKREEERARKAKLRKEKIKARRKKAFEFFHGLGLVKTEKEKKEYKKQREI